ncbi:hypothetical protein EGT74_25890 [Chitinophaga lutea]|uniref:Uncharacterized protein n=1 Tax=Chitinophaga lutea TaxID=2488634 RepID=A0A3N4PEB7_9BACT|nr:hypothetical protein [Chitinophaga lutea]RPE05798.1 hypothetical protein EGT74_25890 [Chitinophaga lutea]
MTVQSFYIPENIDIDDILRKNPINHIDGFNRDKLLYILHLLAEIPSNSKDLTNEEGYVPINAEILRRWIGKGYSDYLTYLQEAGIVESDNHFITGIKSRGYRFCVKYQQPLKSIPVTNLTLLKKMANNREVDKVEDEIIAQTTTSSKIDLSTIARKYKPIEKWYQSGGLKINDKLAHAYNAEIYLQKKERQIKMG